MTYLKREIFLEEISEVDRTSVDPGASLVLRMKDGPSLVLSVATPGHWQAHLQAELSKLAGDATDASTVQQAEETAEGS
jgi:hypothetical protein